MNRITHFEIYTDDPEAVQPFYQEVFGWKFNKFEGGPIEYWLVTTGDDKAPGINGGMIRPRKGQSPGTLNTVAVKSLDQTIKKLEQHGGKICVADDGDPKSWLAGLRGRSSRQRLWNYRAGYERQINEKGKGYDSKYYSTSPRPPIDTRKDLQGISRSRRDGQMASAERIYRQGAPDGRQNWRRLQNVVHEFHYGQESFLRRDVR